MAEHCWIWWECYCPFLFKPRPRPGMERPEPRSTSNARSTHITLSRSAPTSSPSGKACSPRPSASGVSAVRQIAWTTLPGRTACPGRQPRTSAPLQEVDGGCSHRAGPPASQCSWLTRQKLPGGPLHGIERQNWGVKTKTRAVHIPHRHAGRLHAALRSTTSARLCYGPTSVAHKLSSSGSFPHRYLH